MRGATRFVLFVVAVHALLFLGGCAKIADEWKYGDHSLATCDPVHYRCGNLEVTVDLGPHHDSEKVTVAP